MRVVFGVSLVASCLAGLDLEAAATHQTATDPRAMDRTGILVQTLAISDLESLLRDEDARHRLRIWVDQVTPDRAGFKDWCAASYNIRLLHVALTIHDHGEDDRDSSLASRMTALEEMFTRLKADMPSLVSTEWADPRSVGASIRTHFERDQLLYARMVASAGAMNAEIDAAVGLAPFSAWYNAFGDCARREEANRFLWAYFEHFTWPDDPTFGDGVELAFFVLVQHQDNDTGLQSTALEALSEAVSEDRGSGRHLAFLTDRLAVNTGRPQTYGTQISLQDNGCAPQPLAAPQDVDSLREAVGLEPLREYIAGHPGCE